MRDKNRACKVLLASMLAACGVSQGQSDRMAREGRRKFVLHRTCDEGSVLVGLALHGAWDSAGYCEHDEECARVPEFGCIDMGAIAVNAEVWRAHELDAMVEKLTREFCAECEGFSVPIGPLDGVPACENRRCVVVRRTNDVEQPPPAGRFQLR